MAFQLPVLHGQLGGDVISYGQARIPRITEDGFAVIASIVVNVFFAGSPGLLREVHPRRFFFGLQQIYIKKIVVIVNAASSVDKSLFFNRIKYLRLKKAAA